LRAFVDVFREVRGFFRAVAAVVFRFGCGSNQRWQFQLGLFGSAIVATVQRLDARGFCFHTELSVSLRHTASVTAQKW